MSRRTKDGGILFAQEQPQHRGRLDPKTNSPSFATDTHGTAALGIDYKGRVIALSAPARIRAAISRPVP